MIQWLNVALTTLATPLLSGATSMTVTDGSKLPTYTGGQYSYLTLNNGAGGIEVVKITGRTGNVCTIVRAQDNTSALGFSAGASVELLVTAAALRDVETRLDNLSNVTNDAQIPKSTVTAAGDLILGTGAGTVARLPRGADGQVLSVSGGSVVWASGGGSLTQADAIALIIALS